ncbi:flavoprotein [Frankia sp. AgB1.9]|uniref:flavoprotein n=1 Tax=unclassified Frankia TaxID=2632575 RepID=UPI001931CE1D|nr:MULTISPECIES: flavoprotein [unclassified Frankia]MBL7493713.1 flavoprotein [Frankia sp. AgW1.1]MBL7552803.1 flavoprotein [Frankia sp. AgB1.9]MBL7625391.1 flavoprotein [Frankia sp. AgB1.8]
MGDSATSRVLYVIACGAPPARNVAQLIAMAQEAGWDTCLITSPMGRRFVDVVALELLTGHPVRSDYKTPGTQDVLPPPSAMIIAPATCNTINKWAAGISDTLALGLIVEGIGLGLPLVAMPFTNRAQAAHPAFGRSIEDLRSWGVTVLYGEDVNPPHAPRAGRADLFPWASALDALDALTR